MDDRAALALQVAWGADEALGPEPRDRRRNATPPIEPSIEPPANPVEPFASVDAVDAAWRASGGAGLAVTARHFVGRRGADGAAILILGDCPGEAEERSGVAFDGSAGILLATMLASAGISAADLAFGYVVPWRPPGGRPPSEREIAASAPFLRARLMLRPPRIVVSCAAVAGRLLLGAAAGARSRGKIVSVAIDERLTLPCLSIQDPGQAMATGQAKARMWASLRLLRRTLDGAPSRTES